jgi:hypothetical protein
MNVPAPINEITEDELADAQDAGLGAAERLIKDLQGQHTEAMIVAMGCMFSMLERDHIEAGHEREDLRVELIQKILAWADYCGETGEPTRNH